MITASNCRVRRSRREERVSKWTLFPSGLPILLRSLSLFSFRNVPGQVRTPFTILYVFSSRSLSPSLSLSLSLSLLSDLVALSCSHLLRFFRVTWSACRDRFEKRASPSSIHPSDVLFRSRHVFSESSSNYPSDYAMYVPLRMGLWCTSLTSLALMHRLHIIMRSRATFTTVANLIANISGV